MPKKQQIKRATKRMQNNKVVKKNNRCGAFWKRVWNVLCAPFRFFVRVCKRIWKWLCNINIVGVVNLTLLVAIIVLFLLLIIDFTKCGRDSVVVVRNDVEQVSVLPSESVVEQRKVVMRPVKPVTDTLPIKRDAGTNELVNEPVFVAPVVPCPVEVKQIARVDNVNKIMGDVVIDSRGAATAIGHNTYIQGNLYLQNMYKYVLPCGVKVSGNLFLRDVNLLQFCGGFTVTGNIYVSPRSSFGAIPGNARVGGYVVL